MALMWRENPTSGALSCVVPLEPVPANFAAEGGSYRALRVVIEHDKSRQRRAVRVAPIEVERHAGDPVSFEVARYSMQQVRDPSKVGIVVAIDVAARLDRKALGRIASALVPTLRGAEAHESALASWWTLADFAAAEAMIRQVTGATWQATSAAPVALKFPTASGVPVMGVPVMGLDR